MAEKAPASSHSTTPCCRECGQVLESEAIDSDRLLIVFSCPEHGLSDVMEGFDGH